MKVPAGVKVDCGTVEVPENRTRPTGRTVTLAVARIHSRSADPASDPVVNLQGGPGFPSLEAVASAAKSPVLDSRDYIIWDQRGVGFSSPNLDCPETNAAIWAAFATTDSPEVEGGRIRAAMAECRRRLVAEKVDLTAYNTTESAADLDAIRRALGVPQWNLRGVSYGSALAIEAIRQHPGGIRSALLDSVVPPDASFGAVDRANSALRAFAELYRACAEQPKCSATYGDLHASAVKAAAVLDRTPRRTTVVDPIDGKAKPVAITGQDLWAGMFNAMYDADLIAVLPKFLKSLAEGNTALVDLVAKDGIPFAAGQAEAMTASVDCHDRGRLLQPDKLRPLLTTHPELGALIWLQVPELGCTQWNAGEAPASFNRLLGRDTKVPIVVMAGRFDPITPPAGTRRVADALGLPLLLFPDAGHGAVSASACARTVWFDLMDEPDMRPTTRCLSTEPNITLG